MDRREIRGRWRRLCNRIGVYLSDPEDEFKRLSALYQKPVRAWHNLDHVGFCLLEFDRLSHQVDRIFAVEVALWFQHARLDPKSGRNGAASANEAALFCDRAGVLPEVKKTACDLIVGSTYMPGVSDRDSEAYSDVSLAILGQPSKVFWDYENAVAKEYRGLRVAAFRSKRARTLEALLERPSIYLTPLFRDLYETRARMNLGASIWKLRKGVDRASNGSFGK